MDKIKVGEIVDVRFMTVSGVAQTKTLRYEGGHTFFDADMFDGFGGIVEISEHNLIKVSQYENSDLLV